MSKVPGTFQSESADLYLESLPEQTRTALAEKLKASQLTDRYGHRASSVQQSLHPDLVFAGRTAEVLVDAISGTQLESVGSSSRPVRARVSLHNQHGRALLPLPTLSVRFDLAIANPAVSLSYPSVMNHDFPDLRALFEARRIFTSGFKSAIEQALQGIHYSLPSPQGWELDSTGEWTGWVTPEILERILREGKKS